MAGKLDKGGSSQFYCEQESEGNDTGFTGLAPSREKIDVRLKSILIEVLGLNGDQVATFDADTGMFGHLPELDSMAVAGLLTEMEDRLNIIIDDEDVEAEMLETYGGLLAFAELKVAQS